MSDASSVSWLFVPAARPDRFDRARAAGADETILDLEDAVAPEHKPTARASAADWLSRGGSGWVRINGDGTPWHADDIDALVGCDGLRGLVVPKAEDAAALASIAARLGGRRVLALIETARGVRNLDAICATAGLARLAFGSIDLALDIDARESDEALLYARSELVIASRAAGLPAPIDGVTVEFRDAELVAAAAARSCALGFGAKLCIHPAQVGPVNAAFAPDPVELDWARRVLDAATTSTSGTFVIDGRMIDRPLLLRAQRLLKRASRDPDQRRDG
jgi:citrate lyase subunit beta / citryl-CoA lyase